MKKDYILIIGIFICLLGIPNIAVAQWVEVQCGSDHSTALQSDSTLWSWGSNFSGQLGVNSTMTYETEPIQIENGSKWIDFSTGSMSVIAVKSDGTLWGWGYAHFGFLGTGGTADELEPAQIGSDNNWKIVSHWDSHSLALKEDGSLWSWGRNYLGELGTNNTIDTMVPIQVGVGTDWAELSVGGKHSLALKDNGTLWSWGSNFDGQLGIGTNTASLVPVQVGVDSDWVEISAGYNFSLGRKSNGSIWAWGLDVNSQLGNPSSGSENQPVEIGIGMQWDFISAGTAQAFAIRDDGTLYAWGHNDYGHLGTGDMATQAIPVLIGTSNEWVQISTAKRIVSGVVPSGFGLIFHSLGIKQERNFICAAGDNSKGQFGDNTLNSSLIFSCNTSSVDVNEIDLDASISLYPNPTSGLINISIEDQERYNLSVYNLAGNRVLFAEAQSKESLLDLSFLVNGAYIIEIEADQTVAKKIVILTK